MRWLLLFLVACGDNSAAPDADPCGPQRGEVTGAIAFHVTSATYSYGSPSEEGGAWTYLTLSDGTSTVGFDRFAATNTVHEYVRTPAGEGALANVVRTTTTAPVCTNTYTAGTFTADLVDGGSIAGSYNAALINRSAM